MSLCLISASHRPNAQSQSFRLSQVLERQWKSLFPKEASQVFSLENNPLPLWDDTVWKGDQKWASVWKPISEIFKASQAFVIVVPEWGGMVPPGLKNLFLLASAFEFAHKPALIVSVSTGLGGSYPVPELRSSSYKNTHICYLPDHLILRQAGELFKNSDVPETQTEKEIMARIQYSLKLLHSYSQALIQVREAHQSEFSQFPYGP